MMKKYLAAASLAFLAMNSYAGTSAGIAGMMITNDTVQNNNFTYPRNIHTVYFGNDPTESGVFLAYVAYKKIGKHSVTLEIVDKNGKVIDNCKFDETHVTKLPWTHSITCSWGGRQPSDGLTFNLYNTFQTKKEKIGELFLAEKK
ncbi:hypothetical protein [Acinetobacter schindleri]|uniref:hypothetical protein n=2 Tax=Moraxellaceae TaxID=468 RepID=UPI0003A20CBE|nr:hypothetical protein [Acinetobacter schindleri]